MESFGNNNNIVIHVIVIVVDSLREWKCKCKYKIRLSFMCIFSKQLKVWKSVDLMMMKVSLQIYCLKCSEYSTIAAPFF